MATQHDDSRKDEGTMDIRAQEQTFDWFVYFIKWAGAVIAGLLVFLALVNA